MHTRRMQIVNQCADWIQTACRSQEIRPRADPGLYPGLLRLLYSFQFCELLIQLAELA